MRAASQVPGPRRLRSGTEGPERDPRGGALLLEAIFALFLLGVAALATLALLAASLAHFEIAEARGRALPLATEWMEEAVAPWWGADAGSEGAGAPGAHARSEAVPPGLLRQAPGETPVHEHPRGGLWPVVPEPHRRRVSGREASDARMPALRRRRGHTLAELVVALFLAGLLGAVLAALLGASTRAVGSLVERGDEAELRRSVAALLHAELSIGVPGRDWALDGPQAIRLRAFRGYGVPCDSEGGPGVGELRVRWRGDRLPDPARDSVLVLVSSGAWVATSLDGARRGGEVEGAGCLPEAGERIERWVLGPPPGGGAGIGAEPGASPAAEVDGVVLLRLFEPGRYSLEGGALRYRQGNGARQPLTPELLPPGSQFLPAPPPSGGSVSGEPVSGAPVSAGTSSAGGIVVELPPLRWTLHGDRSAGRVP